MPLTLGFVELLGAILLLTAAITDAPWRDILTGHAGELYRQTATTPSIGGGLSGAGAAAGAGGTVGGGLTGAGAASGIAQFDSKPVAAWIAPILSWARAHGWTGTVTSGYRTLAEQTAIYNSGVRPAAVPGQSNHEMTAFPGGAVDVSQASQLAAILRNSPYASVLIWAAGKDPVHFSHPHNGGY